MEPVMTLGQIAQKAGVSIGTVDRVVNKRGRVAKETRKKIEEVITQYGYTPNIAARQLKQQSVLTLGFLFPEPGSGSGYWDLVIEGIHNACQTFKPYNISLIPALFDRFTPGSMLEAGKNLLTKRIDGMILSPVVTEDALELACLMQDIPYIYVDSPLAKTEPLVTIAQSPYRGGLCAGRMMKLLKGSGVFAVVCMFNNAMNQRERIRGFTGYFSNDGNSNIIEAACEGWISHSLFDFMDELYALYTTIDGIFVPSAEGHLAAEYLVDRGRKKDTALIGYDNLPVNRRALLDGAIDCLISQRADNQGYQAIREMYRKCVLGEPCVPVIEIPIDVYFRENI
jgi:LacI family transcriptional regulator